MATTHVQNATHLAYWILMLKYVKRKDYTPINIAQHSRV